MRKTPSYLKGLAETRARAFADVQRLSKLQVELAKNLANAEAEVDACDRLIRKFDPRLNPDLIEPTRAHKGRYGNHGKLREAIKSYLMEAAPNAVTSHEVALAMELEFSLDFSTFQEKWRWQKNSVVSALKALAQTDSVERLHDVVTPGSNGEVGRWRWKSDASLSLDHLRELAEGSGVSVQHCDIPPS